MQRFVKGLVVLFLVFVVSACAPPPEKSSGPDRTVKIVMRDDNTYDPPKVEVTAGETIAFEVTNDGAVVHELLIGDEDEQLDYAEQMENGGHKGHGSAVTGVVVEPGNRETFIYVVPAKKESLYFGCHQPGHYEAGMRGELRYTL